MRLKTAKIRRNLPLIGAMTAYGAAMLGIATLAVAAPAISNQEGVPVSPVPAVTATITPTVPRPVVAAVRACHTVPDRFTGYCVALYLRPAQSRRNPSGSVITNPAGPALLSECLHPAGSDAELGACLTQPAL
jgi:hypothetical protein